MGAPHVGRRDRPLRRDPLVAGLLGRRDPGVVGRLQRQPRDLRARQPLAGEVEVRRQEALDDEPPARQRVRGEDRERAVTREPSVSKSLSSTFTVAPRWRANFRTDSSVGIGVVLRGPLPAQRPARRADDVVRARGELLERERVELAGARRRALQRVVVQHDRDAVARHADVELEHEARARARRGTPAARSRRTSPCRRRTSRRDGRGSRGVAAAGAAGATAATRATAAPARTPRLTSGAAWRRCRRGRTARGRRPARTSASRRSTSARRACAGARRCGRSTSRASRSSRAGPRRSSTSRAAAAG